MHEQNAVIAEQENCSRELSLHEFIAFGLLRADGERLQWLNIKRELAASNLDLNTEAVCTLFTQAAWQAGSKGAGKSKHYKLRSGANIDADRQGILSEEMPDQHSTLRMSHSQFLNVDFCKELMSAITSNLNNIKANWKSDHALSLLIIITLRTLSLSTEATIVSGAMRLLQQIRAVAERWVYDLAELMHSVREEEQISKLQYRIEGRNVM